MNIPDVVGLNLQDALKELEKSGLNAMPSVIQYFPPAKGFINYCDLEERVIRQRVIEGRVELVVSFFKRCVPDC